MKTDLEKLLRTADAESLAPALNAVKPQKLDKETKAALAAAVLPTVKTKAPAEPKGVKKPVFNFLKPVAVIALCAVLAVGIAFGVVGGLRDRSGNAVLPSSDVGATSATPSMGGTESAPPSSNSDPTPSDETSSMGSATIEIRGYAPVYYLSNSESGNNVLETDDFVITLIDADFKAEYGPRVNFTIKSKTDRKIMLQCFETTVNGFAVYCNMGIEYPEMGDEIRVIRGLTEYNVYVDKQDLPPIGMTAEDVVDIGTKFRIYKFVRSEENPGDYELQELLTTVYVEYHKEGAVAPEFKIGEDAVTMLDGNVKIIVDGFDKYDPSRCELRAVVTNNTDKKIVVEAEISEAGDKTSYVGEIAAGKTGVSVIGAAVHDGLVGFSFDEKIRHFVFYFVVKDMKGKVLYTTEKYTFDYDDGTVFEYENAEFVASVRQIRHAYQAEYFFRTMGLAHGDVLKPLAGEPFGEGYDLASFYEKFPFEYEEEISGTKKAVVYQLYKGGSRGYREHQPGRFYLWLVFERAEDGLYYYNGEQFFTDWNTLPAKSFFDTITEGALTEELFANDFALIYSARESTFDENSALNGYVFALLNDMSVLRFTLSEDRATVVAVERFENGDLSVYTDEVPNEPVESEPVESGSESEPVESGSGSEPAESGSGSEPAESGSESEPAESGSGSEPAESGSGSEPAESGSGSEPAESGSGSEPAESGSGSEPAESEDINQG